MTATPTADICPECAAPLPRGTRSALCPHCVLRITTGGAEPRQTLGDYELLGEIARGGMGIVYRARQQRLGREVAVKVLRGGEFAGAEAQRRFRAEAEAVARLRHPGIVAIHDVGEEDGVLWFSMELVPGENLAARTREHPLPAREAAECVRRVAEAIAHAHENGILHRDLKPSNILLDDAGLPRVTDFGLARRVATDSSDGSAELTRTGQVLGSPGYSAPEQALGGTADARTDVYGLGAVLYHLLTSRPPFQGPTLDSIVLQLRDDDPLPPRQLNPAVPRDLETIALHCLAKNPAARYATARDVAEDLARFLRGETVSARPAGPLEKAWRWCRRRPAVAALSIALALALVIGTTVSIYNAVIATRFARDANTAREGTADSLYASTILVAQNEFLRERARFANLLAGQRPVAGQADRRGWEWYYLAGFADGSDAVVRTHRGAVWGAAFSPDGKLFATCGEDGALCILDAETHSVVHRLGPHTAPLDGLDWNPDSRRVAVAARDGIVEIFDAIEGRSVKRLPKFKEAVSVVRWHPGGDILAVGGLLDEAQLINMRTGEDAGHVPFSFRSSRYFDWSSDGALIAAAPSSLTPFISLLSYPPRQAISNGAADDCPASLRWHPSRALLAIGTMASTLRVRDPAADWKTLAEMQTHQGSASAIAFDATGTRIATGGQDGSVMVWDWQAGKRTALCFGHTTEVLAVSWSPAGVLASAAASGDVRFWKPRASPAWTHETPTPGRARWLQWSADGKTISAGCLDAAGRTDSWVEQRWLQTFQSWRVGETLTPVALQKLQGGQWGRWSPDAARLVYSSGGANVAMRHALGLPLLRFAHTPFVNDFVWSPQGDRFAVISMSHPPRGMVVFSASDGKRLTTIPHSPALDSAWDQHQPAAWSYDGKWIAIAPEPDVWDGRTAEPRPVLQKPGAAKAVVWDSATGAPRPWPADAARFASDTVSIAWSADGAALAFGLKDGTVDVRDALTGRRVFERLTHSGWVRCIHWHPDGRRLATAGRDGAVKVLDARSGEPLLVFADHGDARAVAWSPDGRCLVSAGNDQRLLIRDATRGYEMDTQTEK